nr:pecanex protein 1 [Hymenolepis microstoma]
MNALATASQASLEMRCELSRDLTCPSTEDIEEQCRRIGLAGLYLADLAPSAVPSLNRNMHPDSPIADMKSINVQNTPPLNQEPNLPDGVCSNSVPFSSMSLSDPATNFLPRIVYSTWETAEVPDNRAFRNHLRRYMHHITSDVSTLRSRSASGRLSVFPLPPSNHHRTTIRFQRNHRSHNWRLFRHASLQPPSRRSRTLLRTQSRHRSSASSFKNSSSHEVGIIKSSPPNLSDTEPKEPSDESSKIAEQTAIPNYCELRSICSSSGGEEIHPLPSLLSLPSNADVSVTAKVNFGTVRLRKHTSSPAGRRFPSRRRNAVYLVSRSSPCHSNYGNGGDGVVPIPSTSHPIAPPLSSTSRNKGGRISNKNKLLPQAPHLRLPAFPPDINSLDHAYSSPIRHELLPRPEIGRIRTGESEISTASSGMSRPTDAKISKAPTPIPSDRTLSLELQSGSITEGFRQSASSASIYDLVKGRFPTSGSNLHRSVSLSSMHSEAFCIKKMSKELEDNDESPPPSHAVSLQIKTSSAPEDIYEGNHHQQQQPSSYNSIYRLVREPPRNSDSILPSSSGCNQTGSDNVHSYAHESTNVATTNLEPVCWDLSGRELTAAATAVAASISAIDTSVVTAGGSNSNAGQGGNSSGGGGFASSFGGLSLSPSRDGVFSDRLSRSSLRRSHGHFGDDDGIRRGVGIRSDLRVNRRRVRHCTIAYRVRLFPFWQRRFLIRFDRLQLSALFDRKPTWTEMLVTLMLTALVSIFGSLLLSSGAFQSFSLSLLCCVIAGCHYSLIKSVQPDPASPRHGFNRLIIYSRGLVFCLLGFLFALTLILIPSAPNNADNDICPANFNIVRRRSSTFWFSGEGVTTKLPPLTLYGWKLEALWILCLAKDVSGYLILTLPLICLFGLVPQASTLASNVLEQIDIHIFGASGSVNLTSSVFSVLRGCLVLALGFGFCYAAVLNNNPQDVFFSAFWGLYLPLCYLLSRTPNNVSIIRLVFTHITSLDKNEATDSRYNHILRRISLSLQKLLIFRTSLYTSRQQKDASNIKARNSPRSSSAPKLENDVFDNAKLSFSSSWLVGARQSQPPVWSNLNGVGEANPVTERSGSFHLPSTTTLDSPKGIKSDSHAAIVAFDEDEEFPALCGDHGWGGSGRQSLQSVQTTGKIQAAPPPQPPHMSSAMLSSVLESTSPPLLNTPLKSSVWFGGSRSIINNTSDLYDPLPGRIVAAMLVRIRNDLLLVLLWAVLGFAVHVSTVFTVPTLHPILPRLLTWIIIVCGFVLHYIWPQLRKPFPWLLFARSVCPPSMDGRVTGLEIAYHWCHWFERYFLVPAVTMATTTKALVPLCEKFNPIVATFILLITSMKLLRHGFSGGTRIFLNFYFAEVLFTCDFPGLSETFPLDYFFTSIALAKVAELWNKLSFVYIYIAPFQASWGSICHAVAQLASIPHFISTLGNCILSTLLSAPLEPFVASVFFITSYARPIRFWEATQKIRRIESTNTSLLSQLRGVSFEQRLAGDIALGRWSGGAVCAGDIFILASEDLHFLLHIIEVGNGLVTFQMRGLEFVGTYCHEQESNGLSEPQLGDRDCCCCTLHHLPTPLLSPNGAVRLRWLAWQFVYAPYTIEAYRLIDHSAATSLQVIDFRKIVVALFIQCLLYFTARLPNLSARLQLLSTELHERFVGENTADLDPAFSRYFDEDFDESASGVTRAAFLGVYAEWIRYCLFKCPQNMGVDSSDGSDFLTLCYAISLLGRRCLGGVSGYVNNGLETFLHYLHDVFKGDVQISTKDDWVFADVEILNLVVTPAMRVALKLYQDHFTWNPLSTNHELYHAIWSTTENVVICHETDPQWRSAVLNDAEKLFSFRRIDSGATQQCFRFIMMNKQPLSFQVIKLNSECVRGFWSGQLREQIFLRNKNAERGSIQHAKHVLRNLINSSCDQPVGYPIYVSPLITSFAESHPQYRSVSCPNLSIPSVISSLRVLQNRIKQYCKRSYHGRGSDNIELHRLQTSKFALRSSSSFCPHESSYPQHNEQNVSSNLQTFWHFQQRQHTLHESGTATSSLLAAGCGSELASWCNEVVANSGVASTNTSASSPLPPSRTSLVAGTAAAASSVSSNTTAVVHQCDTSNCGPQSDTEQPINEARMAFAKSSFQMLTACLLYFTARLPNLSARLQLLSTELHERFVGENTADLDPAFSRYFDEDFDESASGVTRAAFLGVYAEWIRYCLFKCPQNMGVDSSDGSDFLTLCYAISLLGRRCLGGVSGYVNNGLETFLHYLHDVFKGDVQISTKDDWVFADVEILNLVVTPAMRVALKLYQDHFTWNPLSTNHELYHAIWSTTENVVICHETDPQWRSAVLNDAEKLFSFRRIDSGATQQCFRFIMMNKQPLSFQVIKLNSECVRGFWSGQLREQIFLRNKNAERGSIQHAKHVLRNLINSSCDQPVGYPIYVSPLITSFAESHPQYRSVSCPNLSIPSVISSLRVLQNRIKQYCKRSYHGRGSDNIELHRLQTSKFALRSSSSFCPHESSYPQHNEQNVSSNLQTFWHFQQRQHTLHESGTATSSLLAAGCGSELASWCNEVVANSGVASTNTSASSPLPPSRTSLVAGTAAAASSVSSNTTAVVHQCDTSNCGPQSDTEQPINEARMAFAKSSFQMLTAVSLSIV